MSVAKQPSFSSSSTLDPLELAFQIISLNPGAVLLRRGKDRPEIWLDRFDAARNLENYRRVRADIERRFKSVAAVDLRWRDQIILRPGNGGESPK